MTRSSSIFDPEQRGGVCASPRTASDKQAALLTSVPFALGRSLAWLDVGEIGFDLPAAFQQFIVRLHAHPIALGQPEVPGQAKIGVRSNCPLAKNDFVDPDAV
jgi:hypothetical protein